MASFGAADAVLNGLIANIANFYFVLHDQVRAYLKLDFKSTLIRYSSIYSEQDKVE